MAHATLHVKLSLRDKCHFLVFQSLYHDTKFPVVSKKKYKDSEPIAKMRKKGVDKCFGSQVCHKIGGLEPKNTECFFFLANRNFSHMSSADHLRNRKCDVRYLVMWVTLEHKTGNWQNNFDFCETQLPSTKMTHRVRLKGLALDVILRLLSDTESHVQQGWHFQDGLRVALREGGAAIMGRIRTPVENSSGDLIWRRGWQSMEWARFTRCKPKVLLRLNCSSLWIFSLLLFCFLW